MRPDALAWLMRLIGCRIEADWRGQCRLEREQRRRMGKETHVLTFRSKG